GATATATITGAVGCDVANGAVLANTVTAGAANSEINSANNSSLALTTVGNPPPSITCPANVSATTAHPTDTGLAVSYADPVVTDNCAGPPAACAPPSGSTFPVGVTTVTCTAHDSGGATSTCQFTVSVTAAAGAADIAVTQTVAPS